MREMRYNRSMSKTVKTLHDLLEANGKWLELIALLDGTKHEVLFLKAELLAHALTPALLERFQKIDPLKLDVIDSFRYQLLKATLFRRKKDLKSSIDVLNSLSAANFPSRDHHLYHEYQFQLAVVTAESGQYFRALEMYANLRKENLSPFRRGLSALNECGLLWDQGLFQKMESLIHLIPAEFQMRTKLCLDLAHGRWNKVEELWSEIQSPLLQETFKKLPELEKESILIHFTEWFYLNEKVDDLKKLREIFPDEVKASPVLREIHFDQGGNRETQDLDTDQVDLMVLRFLKYGIRKTQNYAKQIETVLEERELFGPLLPRISEIEKQSTPYAKLWFHYLQNQKAEEGRARLVVAGSSVEFHKNNQLESQIDFSKFPAGLQMLKILDGVKGTHFPREVIHRGLTGTKFVFHLHDQRVHKLLQRTSKRIEKIFGISPWVQPGNRLIQLKYDIVVKDIK